VKRNPMVDEARITDGRVVPYDNDTFDVVFADNVLEHLPDPHFAFREIHRVLKPGGMFLFKTPNKWHYMPIIARSTPHRFHRWISRKRGRQDVDTFPTLYRANSIKDIRRLANSVCFEIEELELIEGRPEYLRMNWLTYLIGVIYERIVNSVRLLSRFRVLLVGRLRKPA
jgi:SAM-dependent methyltransferase